MNRDFILSHPEVNGGQKKLVREETHTEFDSTTGELTRVLATENAYVGKEPDYVKIYTDCQLVFNHLDVALSPYIVAFGKWMTFANFENPDYRCTVRTGEIERQDVAKCVGVSDSMVKKAIKQLIDSEVFIPIVKDGRRLRGIYFVNPWVMSKGEWKDIKRLRAEFEFVTGTNSVLAIESDGTRKVVVPLTQRKGISASKLAPESDQLPGQMSFEDFPEVMPRA